MKRIILWTLILMIFICNISLGQGNNQELPPSTQTGEVNVTIDGCLSKDKKSGKLILADRGAYGERYYLIGYTKELSKYIGGELTVQGKKEAQPKSSVDDNPVPLKVKSWKIIVDPNIEIKPKISAVTDWKSFVDHDYGLTIRYPKTFKALKNSEQDGWSDPNFVAEDGMQRLFSMRIPSDIYGDNTIFIGGYFSAYVSPAIDNVGMCNLFKNLDNSGEESRIRSRRINGILYTEACQYSLSTAHVDDLISLHTYQNGFCYAFYFEFGQGTSTGSDYSPDTFYCAYNHYDQKKFMDLLLANMTFSKPTAKKSKFTSNEGVFVGYQTLCADFKRDFIGTIGKGVKVHWQLTLEGANLSGTEQYTRIGEKLWLKGTADSDGNFVIEEQYPKDHITGIFQGKFSKSCQIMTGYFIKPDGSKLQTFELSEVIPDQPGISTVAVGSFSSELAVNSMTNKVYVAGNKITVINGSDNSTAFIDVNLALSHAVAINCVTNKIYIASDSSNNVTVIDGPTDSTTSVQVGSVPWDIAINPETNKIYVANFDGKNVTVINGLDNSTTTIPVGGGRPKAVAVNPVTNKIYVTNYSEIEVDRVYEDNSYASVFNGSDNRMVKIATGKTPYAIAINPVTNKVYIANLNSRNVSIIDGANNSVKNIAVGEKPCAVAVNSATNKIYVANEGSNNVTVINGADNSTITIAVGTNPRAVAVNPVTNKIYVANEGSNDVTVINGADNSTATIAGPVGSKPSAIAVNTVTNKVYVLNSGTNNVTIIAEP